MAALPPALPIALPTTSQTPSSYKLRCPPPPHLLRSLEIPNIWCGDDGCHHYWSLLPRDLPQITASNFGFAVHTNTPSDKSFWIIPKLMEGRLTKEGTQHEYRGFNNQGLYDAESFPHNSEPRTNTTHKHWPWGLDKHAIDKAEDQAHEVRVSYT